MEWLNYHHLHYFWIVAREGSVARASQRLRLAHPTVSAQIHALESVLGEALFARSGRGLQLTEVGRHVFRYADEIFTLGQELVDSLKDRPTGRPVLLEVGVADVLPELMVRRFLEPALHLPEAVRIVCRADRYDRLLGALSTHALDVVLTDAPVAPGSAVRAYNHLLGECGVTFFGNAKLAKQFIPRFPASLEGAPILLPAAGCALRSGLDQWFDTMSVRPQIIAEFEDSSLLKVFGQDGIGLFPGPSVIERAVVKQHDVQVIGRAEDIREQFFAISVERRLKNPAVLAICDAARNKMFPAS
jgi:LysR family transcriptional activator of nhaA